jgi:hypothetical protein
MLFKTGFFKHPYFFIFTATITWNEEYFLRFPAPFISTDLPKGLARPK